MKTVERRNQNVLQERIGETFAIVRTRMTSDLKWVKMSIQNIIRNLISSCIEQFGFVDFPNQSDWLDSISDQ